MPIRPAIMCIDGLLSVDGESLSATITQVISGIDTAWYCCLDTLCSIPFNTSHVAVPEFDFLFGIISGTLFIGAIYARRDPD